MDIKQIIYNFLDKLLKEHSPDKSPKDLVFYKGTDVKRKININYGGKKFKMDTESYLQVSNWAYESLYNNPFETITKNIIPTENVVLDIDRKKFTYKNMVYTSPSTYFITDIESKHPNSVYIIINFEIQSGMDGHQNVILLERKNNEKNLYHFEPHGINSDFYKSYMQVYKMFIENKFIQKDYVVIEERKVCPIGLQRFAMDIGWCVLYSQLWLSVILHVLTNYSHTFLHQWIEKVEEYLITFAYEKYTDPKDIYALYILFFLEIDYLHRSKGYKKRSSEIPNKKTLDKIHNYEKELVTLITDKVRYLKLEEKNQQKFLNTFKQINLLCEELPEPYKTTLLFNQYFFKDSLENEYLSVYKDASIMVGKNQNCDDEKIFCSKNLYCDYKENICKEYKDTQTEDNIDCNDDSDCDYGICERNKCRLSNRNERCRNSEDCVFEETGFFQWLKNVVVPISNNDERKIYCIKEDDEEYGNCNYVKQ